MLPIKHLLITVALLALAGGAHAALETYEETDELSLNEVQLPAHTSGYVSFRPCPECEPVRRQVSMNTTYQVEANGPQMRLREFLEVARDADGGALYVAYDVESGLVNRIILSVWD